MCIFTYILNKSNMSNNTTKIIGALLLGAAVGVAVGILLAPDKGSETRKKMADGANDLANDAEEEIKEVIDALKKKVSEMESTLSKGLDAAKKMVEEKSNEIKSKVA
jgi:gas vesicle protein